MENKDLMLQKITSIKSELNELQDLINNESNEEVLELVDVVENVEPEPTRDPIKKALIVGINKYSVSPSSNLNGCVNDANNMVNLLTTKFGFKENNITLLTDFDATKQNIMDGLECLVREAIAGDELVFTFSGHGSQVADISGDESDNLDEIICTTDLDWDDPFTDDILSIYFKRVPADAHLTFICDSCHSGTVTKNIRKNKKTRRKFRSKFIIPPDKFQRKAIRKNKFGIKPFVITPDQNHILLAGCAENDYSAEGVFDGKPQGALTYVFCRAERIYTNLTWDRIVPHLENQIKLRGYSQVPQLVTKQENYSKKPFRSS